MEAGHGAAGSGADRRNASRWLGVRGSSVPYGARIAPSAAILQSHAWRNQIHLRFFISATRENSGAEPNLIPS
jgi:hypothetical protein